jgi:Mn2+/Fe2+ NRAMP family transporter
MRELQTPPWLQLCGWICAAVIVTLNLSLLWRIASGA